MKKYVLIIPIIFLFLSCNKDKSTNICAVQTFSFFNESGKDLFDKNTVNHLEPETLKAYNLSGEEVQIIFGEINGIHEFDIYILPLEGFATTHIGELTVDTISYHFKEKGNSQYVNQVYYNGELKMTHDEPTQCGSGSVVKITIKSD